MNDIRLVKSGHVGVPALGLGCTKLIDPTDSDDCTKIAGHKPLDISIIGSKRNYMIKKRLFGPHCSRMPGSTGPATTNLEKSGCAQSV